MTIIESHPFLAAGSEPPTLLDALHLLDQAAPHPNDISACTDALATVIEAVRHNDNELLHEIRIDQPRLAARVDELLYALGDIEAHANCSLKSILDEPTTPQHRRSALGDLARRIRRHLRDESDVVFHALNIDLGAGD